ncbi:MAG: hypothetical protein KAJ55_15550, partial [Anaerolineales bacterium]|nr:hypothetical protein [Anaerolineales bacterium]
FVENQTEGYASPFITFSHFKEGFLAPLLLTSTHLHREDRGTPLPDFNLPSGICRRIHIYL